MHVCVCVCVCACVCVRSMQKVRSCEESVWDYLDVWWCGGGGVEVVMWVVWRYGEGVEK